MRRPLPPEGGLGEGRVERRPAAILAADVAGYSRLMAADEEGTLARLMALRRQLIDHKVAGHHGRIVKTTGDRVLIEFPSVVDAVTCAIAVQNQMATRYAAEAPDRRIEFRIGINWGDVLVEDDDIHGDASMSRPDWRGWRSCAICISAIVRDQVETG